MPCRRHTSGVFAPASASRKIPIICSSLNRLPFICPSPFSDGLYLQTVGREGGTPQVVATIQRGRSSAGRRCPTVAGPSAVVALCHGWRTSSQQRFAENVAAASEKTLHPPHPWRRSSLS